MIIIPHRDWRYPIAIERQYRKELVVLVKQMAKCTKDEQDAIDLFIQENRMDAIMDKLGNLTDNIKNNYYLKISRDFLQRKIDQIFEAVSNFNSNEFSQIIKQSLGIDIFRSEPDLYELMQLWSKENVNLIKSIENSYFDRLENIISNAVRDGTLTKNVIKQIQELTGVSERRAQLIATDQIGKLNGQLTMYRQLKAGINEYIWRTAGDSRVRPSHQLRNRKRFRWDNPPPDGHPGMAIRCRCTAIPVIDTDNLGQARSSKSTVNIMQKVNQYNIRKAIKNKLEKIAGVTAGKPMTWEQADNGNVNPNYFKGGGYHINCQSCVVTMEARLRGYNVEVLPNTEGSMLKKLSKQTNLAWIDPETKTHPKYIFEFLKDIDDMPEKITTPRRLFTWLKNNLQEKARYTIEFIWKGRGNNGHIVCINKDEKGRIRLYDPQTNEYTYDENLIYYFQDVKFIYKTPFAKMYIGPQLLRIDNMEFNKKVVDYIMKGKENE